MIKQRVSTRTRARVGRRELDSGAKRQYSRRFAAGELVIDNQPVRRRQVGAGAAGPACTAVRPEGARGFFAGARGRENSRRGGGTPRAPTPPGLSTGVAPSAVGILIETAGPRAIIQSIGVGGNADKT